MGQEFVRCASAICERLTFRNDRNPPALCLNNGCLDLLTEVGAQCERALIVQLLVSSPARGIAHSFNLDLCSKFQSLPIGRSGKHELRLANLARQRVTGVQTTAGEHLSILALDGHPQYARATDRSDGSRRAVWCWTDQSLSRTIALGMGLDTWSAF